MKKIFGLFVVVFAVALAACNDENTDNGSHWFQQPTAVVAGTTVEVSCLTTFGDGVLTSMPAGFAYAPIGDAVGEFAEITETTVNGKVLSCQLEALEAQTTYLVYAFVVVGGERMQSAPITFQTGDDGDEPEDPTVVKPTFGALTSAALTASSATVSGSFAYTGDKPIAEVYFQYSAPTGSGQHAPVSVDKGTKSATLSGLAASTSYTYRLCVVIGSATYSSESATFTTLSDGGGDPIVPGNTLFAGWAELPTTKAVSGDWYYTYHLTDQNTSKGQKARNYTVCYSKKMMCAVWVAAPMHTFYAKKNVGRTDAYKDDPNLSFDQPGKWSGYTRGHMLGSAERLVSRRTNEQVFYHSNIAPQIQTYFNTGGGAWNTLEDWVDTQWTSSSDTTYQVIGSYWKNTNKKVGPTTIPTHYYKVLLRTKKHQNKWVQSCSRDELQCIAIMVEHRAYAKSEVPKPNQYAAKGMLYSVKKMEEMTGVTFFGNVPNAPKDSYSASDWGF